MSNKEDLNCSDFISSGMMDVKVKPKDGLFEFNDLKMEPFCSHFEEDTQFNSEAIDLNNDYNMQWNIESCFENGIDLTTNNISPPSSPSSSGSTPIANSQSLDLNKIKSRILPNESIKNNICNTFTLIAPKSANGNHIVSKPKILPAPVKPTLNTISFKTNSSINNNFDVSSMLTDHTNHSPVTISKLCASNGPQKMLLTPEQFSKITKLYKQNPSDLIIPASVRSTSELNNQLPLPKVKIDLTKPRCNTSVFLPYNQISSIKRHQRMIRNREAASLSRKKKKEYVTSLEEKISILEKENLDLKIENSALKERLLIFDKLSLITDRPIMKTAKRVTVVLSVFLMISLNIAPLGLFSPKPNDNSVMHMPFANNFKTKNIENLNFNSRNLLWVSDFEDTNSSLNATEHLVCPSFINISESKRIDSELRKWIRPRNFKLLNDSLSMAYVDPTILNTNIEYSKHNEYIGNKNKKLDKLPKKNLNYRKRKHNPVYNDFIEIFDQLKLDSKESLFDSIERQDDTFYVVSFSGDHLLLPASHNASNTTLRPKMSLVFPTLLSNGSDFVTMIQIDCAVTDTKTLHIRDTHLKHNDDFKNNASSNIKQQHDHRNNIAHKPYFVRQSYPGSMFSKMNHELPSY